jgi:exodeoxyribonuclease-5
MPDLVLSDMQNSGVKSVSSWYKSVGTFSAFDGDYGDAFYFGGYAGTGKTSILPNIIDGCGLDYSDVTFCAPTGKAAKVMTGKLRQVYGPAVSAKTIHSAIYIPITQRVEIIKQRLDEIEIALSKETGSEIDEKTIQHLAINGAASDRNVILAKEYLDLLDDFDEALDARNGEGPSFMLNPESQVKNSKLIVVDESSMVGEDIASDLKMFGIPGLAIGDPMQLPPVGDKPGFTNGEPDFFLTEIHRQARDNPIIRLSMDVRNGKMITPGRMGNQVRIVKRRDDEWTLNREYDAQVICGTHKRRWRLTGEIRDMCGYDTTGPDIDEPLMMFKNSKKIPGLVNGTFVTCVESPGDLVEGHAAFDLSIETEEGITHKIRANQGQFEEHMLRQKEGATAPKMKAFDSRRRDEILDWGWVITAHKSQGSQWDNVIVHDESGVFRNDADRWLYTAVTRAANELTVVV